MDQRKNKFYLSCIVTLIFLLTIIPLSSMESDTWSVKSYSFLLPVTELKDFIFKYYEKSGCKVDSVLLGMGCVKITVIDGEHRFEVYLTPDSPLAARIRFENMEAPSAEDQLLNGIKQYLNGAPVARPELKALSKKGVPDIILERMKAVVCIRTAPFEGANQFSGFVIDPFGNIVSTAHGLNNISNVIVNFQDGREVPGKILKIDFMLDLALIQVEGSSENFIPLGNGRSLPDMGEQFFSVGCPDNQGGFIFNGIIDGPPVKVNGTHLFQINMPIHPGSSGSPVFDKNGHFVAIVKGRFRGTDSIGFLIPLSTLNAFLGFEQ